MKRRDFIYRTALASSTLSLTGFSVFGNSRPDHNFQLNYAPHIGMFRESAGDDPLAQLHFMADEGFRAFEDNGMAERSITEQNAMAAVMKERGIQMGVFVAHTIYWNSPNLASGDTAKRNEFLDQIKSAVDVARRVGAQWMTVVPGHKDLRLNMGYQTVHVVDTLKRACEILEPHGITMVLEPLNFRDHPGLFLSESPQAYEICKAVASPSCKILFDIYHQQIQEGNLIPNIDACWDEIGYFQIGDNPGRNEPTSGEINYNNVLKFIHKKGYTGILGMEHGNSKPGLDGERAVIDAYKKVDPRA